MTINSGAVTPPLPPADARFFEDYSVGAVYLCPPLTVDRDEVLAFARAYDPQAMHVDEAWAKTGPFGGLIASGWHTVALMMRQFVDNFLSTVANMVSPGCDEIRWTQPVRPGDVLTVRISVIEARRLRSTPMQGVLKARIEAYNQDDALAASFIGTIFMRCRAPEQA